MQKKKPMQWVVHANSAQHADFSKVLKEKTPLKWIHSAHEFLNNKTADIFVDLLYENSQERKKILENLLPKPMIINSVIHTIAEIGLPCIRINGWPGFLTGQMIEAAGKASILPNDFNNDWKIPFTWVEDIPGFIAPRVIAMIINEAYITLEQKITTRDDIDIAMKLGTNYPSGPFEWAKKIGLNNIYELLHVLSISQPRYTPSALLVKEAKE